MKRTGYMVLAAVALVLMSLVPAYAQLKTAVTVNIPFAFTVDEVKMPAGEYTISTPSEKVVCIQRVGGSEVEVTLTTSSYSPRTFGPAKLVFHKYGTAYFVAQAWMTNSGHVHEFFTSASEIEVARTTPQKTYELAINVK